jgi:hypothetical protein
MRGAFMNPRLMKAPLINVAGPGGRHYWGRWSSVDVAAAMSAISWCRKWS